MWRQELTWLGSVSRFVGDFSPPGWRCPKIFSKEEVHLIFLWTTPVSNNEHPRPPFLWPILDSSEFCRGHQVQKPPRKGPQTCFISIMDLYQNPICWIGAVKECFWWGSPWILIYKWSKSINKLVAPIWVSGSSTDPFKILTKMDQVTSPINETFVFCWGKLNESLP